MAHVYIAKGSIMSSCPRRIVDFGLPFGNVDLLAAVEAHTAPAAMSTEYPTIDTGNVLVCIVTDEYQRNTVVLSLSLYVYVCVSDCYNRY